MDELVEQAYQSGRQLNEAMYAVQRWICSWALEPDYHKALILMWSCGPENEKDNPAYSLLRYEGWAVPDNESEEEYEDGI